MDASDIEGCGVEQITYLPQDREQPTGAVGVIHQEPARRLQVDQQRDV